MAVRETITVSLTPELRAFIRGRLSSGRYGNASEVVRASLRLLEQHEPDLKAPTLAQSAKAERDAH